MSALPKPEHVLVIAEAGVNHNGSIELALQLADVAAEAGADVVKFQTGDPALVMTRHVARADYQKRNTGSDDSMLDMCRSFLLSDEEHERVKAHAEARNIEFLSSPFSLPACDFLVGKLGLRRLKIPSGQITSAPFMLHAARQRQPMIISTGMSTLGDIETMLGVVAFGYTRPIDDKPSLGAFAAAYASEAGREALLRNVTLLHCTTEYPAPFDSVNLRAMDTLAAAFGLPVGLSDHTPGTSAALAAVARGACVIEKHITLDRNMSGPDHKASLEPPELQAMVKGIREIERALGSPRKVAAQVELSNRDVARQSLVAARAMRKGERWTTDNLACKRPGTGVSPLRFWDYLGQPAARDYDADELLDP